MKFLSGIISNLDRPKRNLFWNMFGGSWNALLLLIVTPIYISLVGFDGYGILGFWIMLLSLSGIFDMGIGSSVIREFSMNKDNSSYLLNTLRTFEILIILISIFFAFVFFGILEIINLDSNKYTPQEMSNIFRPLIISVGIQFVATIYSSGLIGYQKHFTLNIILVIINSLRHVLGILFLSFEQNLLFFFQIQILLSTVQVLVTRVSLIRYIDTKADDKIQFKFKILKKNLNFSAGIAITAIGGLIIANIDRLTLAAYTNTGELGKYAVAVSAAMILQLGIQPFYKAYYPKYAELIRDKENLRKVYFESCQLMSSFIIPIIITSLFMAPKIFTLWLGDYSEISLISFKFLIIGIGLSGLMWLPAALQHALGWTKLHASMIYLAILIGIPIMLISINILGTPAASFVWVTHGFIEITLGLIIMHMYIFKDDFFLWVYRVILIPLIPSFLFVFISNYLFLESMNSFQELVWLTFTLLCLFVFLVRYNILNPIK